MLITTGSPTLRKLVIWAVIVIATTYLLVLFSEIGFLFFLKFAGFFWDHPTTLRSDMIVLPIGKAGGEEHLYVTPLVATLYHTNDIAMLVTIGVPVLASVIFKIISDLRKRTA